MAGLLNGLMLCRQSLLPFHKSMFCVCIPRNSLIFAIARWNGLLLNLCRMKLVSNRQHGESARDDHFMVERLGKCTTVWATFAAPLGEGGTLLLFDFACVHASLKSLFVLARQMDDLLLCMQHLQPFCKG
ncbi:hypothetical protein DsansV1_C13g0122261 [Dioscorea sansibarensis]